MPPGGLPGSAAGRPDGADSSARHATARAGRSTLIGSVDVTSLPPGQASLSPKLTVGASRCASSSSSKNSSF